MSVGDSADAAPQVGNITKVLQCVGFHLLLWTTSHPDLLYPEQVNHVNIDQNLVNKSSPSRTLGVYCKPQKDQIIFKTPVTVKTVTKRTVLSIGDNQDKVFQQFKKLKKAKQFC